MYLLTFLLQQFETFIFLSSDSCSSTPQEESDKGGANFLTLKSIHVSALGSNITSQWLWLSSRDKWLTKRHITILQDHGSASLGRGKKNEWNFERVYLDREGIEPRLEVWKLASLLDHQCLYDGIGKFGLSNIYFRIFWRLYSRGSLGGYFWPLAFFIGKWLFF